MSNENRHPTKPAFDLGALPPKAREDLTNCLAQAMRLSQLAQRCRDDHGIKLLFLCSVADRQPPGTPNNKVYVTDMEVHIDPDGVTDEARNGL